MNVQQTPCSPDTLDRFLADQLGDDELRALEDHLEGCDACRGFLDRKAAEGSWWDEVRGYLAGSALAGGEAAGEAPSALCGLESYLGPTDDPRMLGRLGGYEVVGVVGRGGMGVVLKAWDPPLGRYVAVKVLAPHLALNAAARQRFAREARAAAAVMHDNVMPIHAVAEANGLPYLVMPYVPGPSLEKRLRESGPFPVEAVLRVGMQIAAGLAAAHAQGLVHRDIKPANILLEEGVERVRITDFGLARAADDASLTSSGVIAGTPEYMSPEQARGESVDFRSDLFSLGSVLYALCAGRPPFRASTTMGVLWRVEQDRPRPLREINPDVPEWLARVVEKLQAREPAERFQSAAEVAALLEGYLAHLRQPATVPAPALAPPPRSGLPRRRITRGLPGRAGRFLKGPRLAVLLLVAVLALGLAVWQLAGQGVAPEASPSGRQHLVYDFRKPIDDLPGLTLFGPDAESYLQTDAQGLRITLPADRPDDNNVGVELVAKIHGDFDINLGYELLDIGAPIPIPGAGVQMRLFFDPSSPSSPMETVTRIRSPFNPQPAPLYGKVGHDGDIFAAFRLTTMPNGNETGFENGVRVRAVASKGRLRLKRTGTRLDYLAADEGEPYCTLRSEEVGAADAKMLRAFGFSGWGPVAVDVRLTDLVIDADALPDGLAAGTLPARVDWSKAWLSAALLAGLLITLPLGVGLCVWMRRRAAAKAPAPPAAAPPGSFACPGCGTRLRARPDVAGKRLKCPRCAATMQVPGTAAARDEAPAPPAAG